MDRFDQNHVKCSNNKKLEKEERQEMPKRQEDNRFVAILEHKQTTHTQVHVRGVREKDEEQ